jgi:uncharacterized protein DUF1778
VLSTDLSSVVANLPLTATCKHEDRVDLLDVAVQSHVATDSASDDQLARVCGYGFSNKRIVLDQRRFKRLLDLLDKPVARNEALAKLLASAAPWDK